MEVAERWAAQYPEIDVVARSLRELSGRFRALGSPTPPAEADEARAAVLAELSEFQELVDALGPKAEPLRPELAEAPLTSLEALHSQLEAETRLGSGTARAMGGEAMCGTLRAVMDSAGKGATPAMNRDLEGWVRTFLREPLDELQEHERQIARFLENPAAPHQQRLVKQIGELSALISRKDFNPDRVELMDTRSVLAQQLLASYRERVQFAGGEGSAGIERMLHRLAEKLHAFEVAHAESVRARREEVARHRCVAETLEKNMESLAAYLQERTEACHWDRLTREYDKRREVRAEKVTRTLSIVNEAFDSIFAVIRECRHDASALGRAELELRLGLEEGNELRKRLGHYRDFHVAAASSFQESVALDLRFADWVREAHRAMQSEVARREADWHAELAATRARMLALWHAAMSQVRTQRAQLEEALEYTVKEHAACQQTLSVLEFSRPSDEQVKCHLQRIKHIEASTTWQERELEALTALEQRLADEAGEVLGPRRGEVPVRSPRTDDEGAAAQREAEEWAAGFFYTEWQAPLRLSSAEPAPEPAGGARAPGSTPPSSEAPSRSTRSVCFSGAARPLSAGSGRVTTPEALLLGRRGSPTALWLQPGRASTSRASSVAFAVGQTAPQEQVSGSSPAPSEAQEEQPSAEAMAATLPMGDTEGSADWGPPAVAEPLPAVGARPGAVQRMQSAPARAQAPAVSASASAAPAPLLRSPRAVAREAPVACAMPLQAGGASARAPSLLMEAQQQRHSVGGLRMPLSARSPAGGLAWCQAPARPPQRPWGAAGALQGAPVAFSAAAPAFVAPTFGAPPRLARTSSVPAGAWFSQPMFQPLHRHRG